VLDIVELDNGLRVVNEFMPDVESVSINVWVNTGSRNETVAQNGISHFIEHMAFKGTKTKSTRQIAEEFDNLGGRANAFTSTSKTAFYIKVLKEYVEKAVGILADIFQNSVFSEEEMEKEREVILQELAMVQDDPTDVVYTNYMSIAYKNQPLGRAIIGTKKNITSFKRSDIIDYINSQYLTNDIVISFAGNCKIETAVSLVKSFFYSVKVGKNVSFKGAKWIGGNNIKNKKLEQTQIILGYESCPFLSDDFFVAETLSVLLGGGMSSRLFQEIREKRGLCYTISANNCSTKDTGHFDIYCATAPDKVDDVLQAINEEMLKVTKNITVDEFDRTMTKLKTSILMSRESNSNRSQKNASDILSRNRIISVKEVNEKLNAITIKNIQDYTETILSKSNPSLSLLGKTHNKTTFI
jgi:predicted Zn-dependent peptidase